MSITGKEIEGKKKKNGNAGAAANNTSEEEEGSEVRTKGDESMKRMNE